MKKLLKTIKSLTSLVAICAVCISLCTDSTTYVTAKNDTGSNYVKPVNLTTKSVVSVNKQFGEYMSIVDENIYYSMAKVTARDLEIIYGNKNTPMFNMAKKTINPCMAFATTWGEAGSSYPGISLTTVMDFNPDTYVTEIDWISLSSNMEQVDSAWYYTNTKAKYNTNSSGKAWRMPVALLQFPRGGDRSTSAMVGLGVGPYQVTSSDWDSWDLDSRVNPIWGFQSSLKKCGTPWINCGIDPISDLTVYAALSLGHQGGGLIDMSFGKQLINTINREDVQNAFNKVGYQMYKDALEKSYTKKISTSDINLNKYVQQLNAEVGFNFGKFNGGPGSTNKGNYVAMHCLRYVFYKYYFTSGN